MNNPVDITNIIYQQLVSSYKTSRKKLINNSLLFTLFTIIKNERYKLLTSQTIDEQSMNPDLFHELVKTERIRKIDEGPDSPYILTLLAIMELESQTLGITANSLLKFLDNEFLDFQVGVKPLKSPEKVILFSLITMRNFSEVNAMDLNSLENCQNWMELIENDILPFLYETKAIPSKSIFDRNTGHEHPMAFTLRRMNDLGVKTHQVYVAANKSRYFLDVDGQDPRTASEILKYVFSKIFNQGLSYVVFQKVQLFLKTTLFDKGPLFHTTNQMSDRSWDLIIDKALEKLVLDQ